MAYYRNIGFCGDIKKNFLFIQQIPSLENYLRLMLDNFFRTVRKLELDIEKIRLQECER